MLKKISTTTTTTMILKYSSKYKMDFNTNINKAKSLNAYSGSEWINMVVHQYKQ